MILIIERKALILRRILKRFLLVLIRVIVSEPSSPCTYVNKRGICLIGKWLRGYLGDKYIVYFIRIGDVDY
jgi:hypothetical protein